MDVPSEGQHDRFAPPDDQPDDLALIYQAARKRAMLIDRMYIAPWWLIIIVLGGLALAFQIATNSIYAEIFNQLQEGISMTLGVSFVSYFSALFIALIVGIIRSNAPQPPTVGQSAFRVVIRLIQTVLYNIATLYVQVMRGLPILIVLLVTAFVLVPLIRDDIINASVVPFLRQVLNNPDIPDLFWRGSSAPSAIVALAVTYGAYMSETIRAGIQSVDKGQVEAAKSIGMTYWQTLRYIVLPQAFRNVLPPLGNDMIAMVKDSSLLAILGVRDITQVAKTSAGRSFRYIETYTIVAILYLVMTIFGSILVRALEDTLSNERETPTWVVKLGETWDRLTGKSRRRREFLIRHGFTVDEKPKRDEKSPAET